ncbi:MAG: hypothetical protein AABY93_16430 [Bacteroidota bacterium]
MKKILALSLSVLLCTVVFAGGTDNAFNDPGMGIIKKDANTFKIYYKAAKAGNVKVSILDSKNNIVFREHIKTIDGFVRPYNLRKLDEGEYTIEISDSFGKQVEKIHNYADKVKKVFNVVKIQGEDKFVLTVSGKGSETIHVKIYDGFDALVYDEDKLVSGDFAQLFNLENLKGTFKFEVTGENGESKTIHY